MNILTAPRLSNDTTKFSQTKITADGSPRAFVELERLETLWFNTGTLCNLTCRNCYIESSPKNDRLVYLSLGEVTAYLDEIGTGKLDTCEIGFTGGEPFMNPDLMAMLEASLSRGVQVLVLTNAMRPMMKCSNAMLALKDSFGDQLKLRVSLDHYTRAGYEIERGKNTWSKAVDGVDWLEHNGFSYSIAGRSYSDESEGEIRTGFGALAAERGWSIDANTPSDLIVFPEMDASADVPEITTACWSILGKRPSDVMCATSRMVVKHKGREKPNVVACTLLPYDDAFNLGETLTGAVGSVYLKHPHCATFCVLGGASCSNE